MPFETLASSPFLPVVWCQGPCTGHCGMSSLHWSVLQDRVPKGHLSTSYRSARQEMKGEGGHKGRDSSITAALMASQGRGVRDPGASHYPFL